MTAGRPVLAILRSIAAALLVIAPAARGRPPVADPGQAGSARARHLMGTRLTIECLGEVAPQVFDEAFDEVARLEAILSNWIESSELSRLNRTACETPMTVSNELMHAVEVSLAWAERTSGAFDPTVESLVRKYGIRDGAVQEESASRATPVVGWRHVVIDSGQSAIQFDRKGIGIDLGGIGKGIALDEAAKVLQDRDVTGGLLDFGGQVVAFGESPSPDGWLIGVADPARRDRIVATIRLRAGSLATSGNSERALTTAGGTMVGHILDPHSGAPARFGGTVSVLAEDGTMADALSTALFVMGPEKGKHWAETREIPALYIWRTTGGEFEFLSTAAMRAGVDWAPVERSGIPGG